MQAKNFKPIKSFDLLSMALLFAIVLGISTAIISQELSDIDRSMGLSEAENLAFQLTQGGFEVLSPSQMAGETRGIASASSQKGVGIKNSLGIFESSGSIGKDPWGQAFRYKVIRDKEGLPTHVLVWSLGPNLEQETPEKAFQSLAANSVAQLEFQGDDFGYVHSVLNR